MPLENPSITRKHRLLVVCLVIALVSVLAAAGWALFSGSSSPTPAAADGPSTTPVDEADPSLLIDPRLDVAPLPSLDVVEMDVDLQIDRSRASLGEVVAQFRNRTAATPDDHISLTLLGSVLLAQAREEADLDLYSEAEVVSEQVLELAPTSVDGQLLRIAALAARHDFETALDESTMILAIDPDNIGALTSLGDAQLALGDTDAADATFRTLAASDRNASVVSRLSRTAYLTGDSELAADLAVEALELAGEIPLRPSDAAFYWFQLGFVLFEGGDVDGAATSLEAAVEIAPHHPGANELLARVRASQGRLSEAIATYRGLLERGPAADLHGELARLLRLSGEDAEADVQVELGLELARETIDSYPAERRHLASFFVSHDPDIAVELAEADIATRQDAGAYDTLGWALHAAGREAEADTMMRQAVADGPQSAALYFRAAIVADAVGDDQRAVPLLRAALTLNPNFDPIDAPVAQSLLQQLEG